MSPVSRRSVVAAGVAALASLSAAPVAAGAVPVGGAYVTAPYADLVERRFRAVAGQPTQVVVLALHPAVPTTVTAVHVVVTGYGPCRARLSAVDYQPLAGLPVGKGLVIAGNVSVDHQFGHCLWLHHAGGRGLAEIGVVLLGWYVPAQGGG